MLPATARLLVRIAGRLSFIQICQAHDRDLALVSHDPDVCSGVHELEIPARIGAKLRAGYLNNLHDSSCPIQQ